MLLRELVSIYFQLKERFCSFIADVTEGAHAPLVHLPRTLATAGLAAALGGLAGEDVFAVSAESCETSEVKKFLVHIGIAHSSGQLHPHIVSSWC